MRRFVARGREIESLKQLSTAHFSQLEWQAGQLEQQAQQLQQQTTRIEQQIVRLDRQAGQLGLVRGLNSAVIKAKAEKEFVEVILDLVKDQFHALGCSFVPLDEWGQALATYSRGFLPEPVMQAWAEHLISPETQERCRVCRELHSSVESECPLKTPFPSVPMQVQCLPLRHDDRTLGMMNIYLPGEYVWDSEEQAFLEGLLSEMAIAIEYIRLRNQEIATLTQLQMLRSHEAGLTDSLGNFLDLVLSLLHAEFIQLITQPTNPLQERRILRRGVESPTPGYFPASVIQAVMDSDRAIEFGALADASLFAAGRGSILAAPLRLPGRPVIGVLAAGYLQGQVIDAYHLELILSIAAQLAVLVEQERLTLDLEYRIVIKERLRLAREIHDGLAQTLAFLKMQTAQMQNYLARGDIARVEQLLKVSHHTLNDAYLDTRYSIDNLRLTASDGLVNWLEQVRKDFEGATRIKVELSVEKNSPELPAEIQAQLIRIVQEALSNIRKHAMATCVWVTVRQWSDDIILEVKDNGIGFSPEDVPGISQYGLRGMRERAEMIGADFQIISQPQNGTTVEVRLPHPFEETLK